MVSQATLDMIAAGQLLREIREGTASFAHEQMSMWQTIGGHPAGDKKRVGGTPVKIASDGKIVAGPKKLEGKKVDELGKKSKRPETREYEPTATEEMFPEKPDNPRLAILRGS